MKNTGKPYEQLVYKIYQELEPLTDVKLNDKIFGHISGTEREIDISLKINIAGSEILMIVQVKDHKKPVDLKLIGEFDSVIRDVEASKGILICSSGFSKKAKDYAKKRKISLFTALDANSANWKDEIEIPVVRKSFNIDFKFNVIFNVTSELHCRTGGRLDLSKAVPNMVRQVIYKRDGSVTTLYKEFISKWESNIVPKTKGTHRVNFHEEGMQFEILGGKVPVATMELEYQLNPRYYFKFFKPKEYRGLKDYLNDTFKPTYLTFSEEIPFINDGTWKYEENPKEISIKTTHLYIEQFDFGMEKVVSMKMLH